MAWRNYLTDAWRRVSIRNGFEQVDGPIFESLDLYKVKSDSKMGPSTCSKPLRIETRRQASVR